MTISFTNLFTVAGKAMYAQQVALAAVGTTVPTEVDDLLDAFNALTPDAELEATAVGIPGALSGWQSGSNVIVGGLQTFMQRFVVQFVDDDAPQPDKQLATALRELIQQMQDNAASVDASTVSAAIAYDADNTADGRIVVSVKRGDGLVQENLYDEVIDVTVTSDGLTGTLRFAGEPAADSLLSHEWPLGSGAAASLAAVSAASSLLSNGDMEDEDDVADAPDDWYFSVGTIATTVKVTNVEVQTIAITGTPTGGYYTLLWTNADGDTTATDILAYNASSATVQAALREIPGLESVTVAESGTTPNLTHTVTFTGKGGNVSEFTSDNHLTGGTPVITHATTTSGTAQVFAGGKALELDSDGAQLTTMYQRLTGLEAQTAYAFSLWAIADVVPAAGRITVDLIDGVSGTVIRDRQGMLNSFKFACADLSASVWKHTTQLAAAVNEVQTLTITGTPTGGTFTLTFDGQTTGTIAFDADAATVQAALIALSNIGTGDVSCGGGALPGTPVTITFQGRFAGRAMPLITADGAGLTGGTTPAAAVALTTEGSTAETVFRMPLVVPDIVYLRVRISTAISAGTSVFLDHLALSRMQSLYLGGPLVAVFSGLKEFKRGDLFTITMTNDRGGLIQEWCNRNFGMAQTGLLLPSDTGGGETISDGLVA